jgi:hypothetical protein
MRWFLCALSSTLLICTLAGCGEEEGANAGKIQAPTPPKDLEKMFQRPTNKKAASTKGAWLSPIPPGPVLGLASGSTHSPIAES